ncbi:MAG: DUF5696 domain-containing protein [Defluviitaleaceae bacterium]|nr:DUF5696 domain-containing protein [Defluviitaleaceae bacterium]MCL2263297.1 DUF5696 domain-containing protein [Defluviitaleaceae bacterium]
MKISAQAKRAWRNRILFVAIVALGVVAYIIYINSFTIYDFSHLTADAVQDFGESLDFQPIGGVAPVVTGMVRAAQTDYLALYINENNSQIAVVDLRYGHNHIWYSSPPGAMQDMRANPFERGTMRSHIGFRFFTEARLRQFRWLYPDSKYENQFEIHSIPNGVRVNYIIGDMDLGIFRLPFFIETEYFNTRVMGQITDMMDIIKMQNFWRVSEDKPGFMQLAAGIIGVRIPTDNMLALFDSIGWTWDETVAQNELSGAEVEATMDYFRMTLEFILDDDRLIVNMPLSEFTTDSPVMPFNLDFMKFFGAAGLDQDGFMLVPSGAGGVIRFNNGKEREEPFMSAVYGMDSLTNIIRPQVTQPVRLPVFGIQNETKGAAFLAQVYRGSGLATVNADVAGRTNSYNHAWFSFTLRASEALSMPGGMGGGADMMVVQDEIFQGDITVIYHFLSSADTSNPPGVGEMAEVYRNFLVENDILTPLDGPGDRTFYMDIIGAIDIQRHFMGTPFITTEVMTTLADAERFVEMLNEGASINAVPVQMQLHGWFNRGINHDVAKNVRRINAVGSRQEMLDLNALLQRSGGNLNPAVNFQFTNYYSRRFNRNFESAKDLAGYIGFMSRYTMRDSLTVRFSPHANDWYLLVHPGALPFHIERFIPAFADRTAMDGLALTDLGDILTESLFRRDAVDRESARLIIHEQMGLLYNELDNLVVFGGNDYSFEFASHLVDVPTQADLQYIIDYEVPFFPMVVHGFIEFAGRPSNMREDYSPINVLLNSMATGASPRYTLTAVPTRNAQFSPHERFYSTHYVNWIEAAIQHYNIFNEVFAPLRGETISDFEVLAGGYLYVGGRQVTVTEFSNGTRIYVNNTTRDFDAGGVTIPAEWFVVR